MEINENLFDLTPEQIELSKEIYGGKIIKCLVAPYHTYNDLEKIIPYTKTTFLFPERDLNAERIRGLISMIVNSPNDDEFRIITASQSVILDMIDGNVRILTEGGSVVPSPVKTFLANIHDIRYSILENPAHRISEEERNNQRGDFAKGVISDLIKYLKSQDLNKSELIPNENNWNKSKAKYVISLVGEPLLKMKLAEMFDSKFKEDYEIELLRARIKDIEDNKK